MTKPIHYVVTNGVHGLIEEGRLKLDTLKLLFDLAKKNLDRTTFISFQPQPGRIHVGDGNKTLFYIEEEGIEIPRTLWINTDDYGEEFVMTALLPSEY